MKTTFRLIFEKIGDFSPAKSRPSLARLAAREEQSSTATSRRNPVGNPRRGGAMMIHESTLPKGN
jgi:hypothetical protein